MFAFLTPSSHSISAGRGAKLAAPHFRPGEGAARPLAELCSARRQLGRIATSRLRVAPPVKSASRRLGEWKWSQTVAQLR